MNNVIPDWRTTKDLDHCAYNVQLQSAEAEIDRLEDEFAELTARCERLGWHAKRLEEKLIEVVDELNENIEDDSMTVPGDIEVQILRSWSKIQDGDIPDKWPGDALGKDGE